MNRNGNSVFTGAGEAHGLRQTMEAYDALPAEIRLVLRGMCSDYNTVQVRAQWERCRARGIRVESFCAAMIMDEVNSVNAEKPDIWQTWTSAPPHTIDYVHPLQHLIRFHTQGNA